MNFDGTSSTIASGDVNELNAKTSISLVGKYRLPTDTPVANEVIQTTGVILPNGEYETHWSVTQGVGDVSSSVSSSISEQVAVFDGTSGKIIKNSNITSSSITRNPAVADLEMNNLEIKNVNKIQVLNELKINDYTMPLADGTLNQVITTDGAGVASWSSPITYDQSLNTEDGVVFASVISNSTVDVVGDFGFGRMSTTGFNTQIRSQNAVGGVGDVNRKSRGSRATPTAIIDNDGIFEEYNSGHDGVNYYDCVRTLTKADGDWSPSNHGATFIIETIDRDTTNITEKIKIDGAGTVLSGNILINNNLNFDNGLIVSSLGRTVITDDIDLLSIKHSGVGLPQIQLDANNSIFSDSSQLTFMNLDNFNMTLQSSEIIVQAPSGDADLRIARQDLPNAGLLVFNNIANRGSVWQFGTQPASDNLSIAEASGEGALWEFDNGLQKSIFSTDVDITGNVEIGSSLKISNAYTMPTVNGGLAQYLAPNPSGFASWETLPQPSYGEQFFNDNSTPTVITTQNVWVDIAGTRNAGNLLDFNSGLNNLTFTGTPKSFQTSVSLTWQIAEGKAQEFEIGFFKNGLLVPEGVMRGSLDDNNTFPRNVSSVCILPLDTNDTVTVKIRNIVGVADVIVISMSFVLVSIAGATSTNNGAPLSQTLQEVFDISNAPQIATEASPLVLKSPIVATRDVFNVEDQGGTTRLAINGVGHLTNSAVFTLGATVFQNLALGEGEFQYTMPQNSIGAIDGDSLTYDETNLGFEFKRPAVKAGWSSVSRLDQRTIQNNVLELQLTDSMSGLVLPANTVKAGDTFLITSTGNASAFDQFQQTVFRLKLGGPLGSLIADGFPQAMGWSNTLQYYKYEVMVCFRSVGSAAALSCVVSSNFGRNAVYSSSINTTIPQAWALTLQFLSPDPANVLQQEMLTIRKIV